MANTPDGGPAFPFPDPQGPAPGAVLGMSLRDWFAGQAMNGLLSDSQSIVALKERFGRDVALHLGEACYQFADGMLAARDK